MRQHPVTCLQVGAHPPDQVHDHLGALDISFSPDEEVAIDAVLADAS
ncbi:MAG: hypothetical protein GKR89_36880 [Candidatus Latescibacteria bacterium]|nr:hypothetical protein [Candidatus Latescibacterota bacterium]